MISRTFQRYIDHGYDVLERHPDYESLDLETSAADTIAITFDNPTAATITPTALESYVAFIFRPEHTLLTNATA